MATQTLTRPNRYPAACVRCGGQVAANAGLLARDTITGKWAADHPGDCPPKPSVLAVPMPTRKVTEDGIYQDPTTGTIYKVQIAKQGSGNLYAKQLHLKDCEGCDRCTAGQREDGTRCYKGKFRYAPGAIHTIDPDWKMGLDAARAFGKLYGVCVRCGADLTDERSIAEGLGRICAGRF